MIQFEELIKVLPEGWEAKAKELGALKRSRRIKTAQDLLRLNFLYLTDGKSFGNTSALLKLGDGFVLNKVAIHKRIGNSGPLLKYLCEQIFRENKTIAGKPAWLGEKDVYLVDATDEPVCGSASANYRLHYAVGLFDLGMKEMLLTDTGNGEKLSNFKNFGKNDVVIGDRGYCSIQGMEYLKERGSDFIIRFATKRFNLYNKNHRKVNEISYFKGLKEGESGEIELFYLYKGEYKPVRLCAIRKTKEAEERGLQAIKKARNSKDRKKELSKAQLEHNRYVVIMTSIHDTESALLLETYRLRWQIELVFKRLKSIFHYNEIPSKLDKTARAWFYGKLLLAAFCETWVNKSRFSPSAESEAC